MTDKDKIDDNDIVNIIKKRGLENRTSIVKKKDDGVIDTIGKKDVAKIMQDLDKTVEEKSKDMDCEILVEKDEFGKTKFVIREKVKDNEKEFSEAVGTELIELTEATFQDARFEEEDNVIRNVCLLSSLSKNNRKYLDKAMNDVTGLASGVKVFADHPKRGETVRSVREIIGQIENPHRSGKKIYGNLRVLSSHKDWVFALAREMPNIAGMSILAKGKMHPERDSQGRTQVESVSMLKSIDLVSEPATTQGMYEQKLTLTRQTKE